MTVNELITSLNEIANQGGGDLKVVCQGSYLSDTNTLVNETKVMVDIELYRGPNGNDTSTETVAMLYGEEC